MKQINACIYDIVNKDYKSVLLNGINRIKLKDIIKSDDRVLIKPNLTWTKYKEGVTTNPSLLNQLTAILKNHCKEIYMGESNAANQAWTAEQSFKGHGLFEIAKKNGFELINLTKKPTTLKNVIVKGENIKLKVSKFILDKIDILITVPVLKIHAATGISLGLKNQWGCLPDPMRLLYHPFLHKGIVAVNKIYNPKISIIDATYGLTRSGPIFGDAIKLNKILMSNNVTALDIIASSFMGVPYEGIKHIKIAKEEFLKNFNKNQIIKYGNFENIFQFRLYRSFFDKVSVLIMYQKELNNLFYNSVFSKIIQKFMNFYKILFNKESIY